jgi:hypothetical protein
VSENEALPGERRVRGQALTSCNDTPAANRARRTTPERVQVPRELRVLRHLGEAVRVSTEKCRSGANEPSALTRDDDTRLVGA